MDEIALSKDERLFTVNDDIRLIESEMGLTFGTDALLLASFVDGLKQAHAMELGGGSGIISRLLLARKKASHIVCVELQPYYAELIRRNAHLNGMADLLRAMEGDVRTLSPAADDGTYHFVFTNPPYMTLHHILNMQPEKAIARHELNGTIDDFCKAAAAKLKYGGYFYCVHRPERLSDLLCSMRVHGIEPKKLTAVHADKDSAPCLILVKGKRGAASGILWTPPLFLYEDRAHTKQTDDYTIILASGSFPCDFIKR